MLPTRPLIVALLVALALPATANDYTPALTRLVDVKLRAIAHDPVILAAVRARNAEGGISEAEIARLDAEWMASVGTGSAHISAIAASPASVHLVAVQAASDGQMTEIFVMDAQGLNVAMSEVTSDYMQGDEAKWQKTFLLGVDAIDISDVDFDESAQIYQIQVSFTITDPDTGAPIGAITFGLDAEQLD